MFEAIVAASPDDIPTLEVLKEAYWKIGRPTDAITTSKHLGSLFEQLGKLAPALAEYESIQRELAENCGKPEYTGLDDMLVAEVELKVVELREKLRSRHHHGASNTHASIALNFDVDPQQSGFNVAQGAPLPTSPVEGPSPARQHDDFVLGGYTTPQKPPTTAPEEPHSPKTAPEANSAPSSSSGLAFPEGALLLTKNSPSTASPSPQETAPPAPVPSLEIKDGVIPFKLQDSATPPGNTPSGTQEPPALANTLIATPETRLPNTALRVSPPLSLDDDGLEPLIKFLTQQRLAPPELLATAAEQTRQFNQSELVLTKKAPAASLLFELEKAGTDIAPIVSSIIDRTKFAYIPLEFYDIDRQIVRMLSENLTLGRLIIPFDLLGRTLMVAIDNPFDAAARNAVQESVDFPIQWHIALPQVIQKILRSTYRLAAL